MIDSNIDARGHDLQFVGFWVRLCNRSGRLLVEDSYTFWMWRLEAGGIHGIFVGAVNWMLGNLGLSLIRMQLQEELESRGGTLLRVELG